MTPLQMVKAFGNIRQTALNVGVSRKTIYDWLRKRKIPEWAMAQVLNAIERRNKSR